ncbi:RecQ family ATP-dependent DNA helicase [Thalassorhabdomicrobium marinisediminis]|uniref:DNA 3'-5' helicase n=1 Tax=Thalassorhabdomicrobium marinisediminis TaxID=2170577 RepID=A0A2T7FVI3_9RHOB|nr:RecQ family ATP-dependent DNA helicase [Thalassorhabdomicrobium marinisediminis]PVA06162.1 RecQ family ATP-dependent DNA helicase [Thalassorhabdomicrobium marinisediminis]
MRKIISRGISKVLARERAEGPELARPGHSKQTAGHRARDPYAIISRCLSVDLEVDPKSARIFAFAAVPESAAKGIVHRKGDVEAALEKLELFSAGFTHVIGHNILRHDLPHLMAVSPRFAKLADDPIDTLWLNPLAFPRNPYHRLVKHYHDGRLQSGHVNEPEYDARLVFEVLRNQIDAFVALNAKSPELMQAYHWLCCRGPGTDGFERLFSDVRDAPKPSEAEANLAIRTLLETAACGAQVSAVLDRLSDTTLGWPMAYALSWISVAGGDSVMPPWVRAQFRDAARLVKDLRDTNCRRPDCAYCTEHNDPARALERWFGFPSFRPEPVDEDGRPLQEKIVATAMDGEHLLGILPTGTGKSVCYQIPALSRFDKTGALTVVISPLVALMADQVQGLARAGIASAVTINGLLSLPERQDALDKVRLGDAAILLISPEQLRSTTVRSVLAQREVGLWVLDEAHCVSKWGHDFRPDYRYVSRFIKENSGEEPVPVLCLTATAKPDVVQDICGHFKERLGAELTLIDGGASRSNLSFEVLPTQRTTKLTDILDTIEAKLPREGASGAVVYCATRNATERVAEFLKQQGVAAERYHAGLSADDKQEIQESFRIGNLRVIAATNAFGMGVDKPDIRLVVHGDVPGSLENYLQEAGRAGRDREPANCVLLFNTEDVERQFSLSARSRLARHEIGAILKALRRLDSRTGKGGEIVATPGEIVHEEKDRDFQRDSNTDDTRVKTAVSWLEEAHLLNREENRVQVFPASLRVKNMKEVREILATAELTEQRRKDLAAIVQHIINAPQEEGITTDELCGISGLTVSGVRNALADLEALGIAKDDTNITIFVHARIENASPKRFEAASSLEADLISILREQAPDVEIDEAWPCHLASVAQALRERGHASVRPDMVEGLLRGIAQDGRDMDGGRGNIGLRKVSKGSLLVRTQRSWAVIDQTAQLRRQGAERLVSCLIDNIQVGVRGKDIAVETTLGDLLAAINSDALLRASVNDPSKLMDRALLWLHEQQVVTLGKGLSVFRSAMTLHINPKGGTFTTQHFAPLEDHYSEQTVQTHVMAAYASKGMEDINQAQHLARDYFALDRSDFMKIWMPGRISEFRRQATPQSYAEIVSNLGNPIQEQIVRDDREQTNVLVLAGPGSGKTRVLVHRVAYLVRIKREDPNGILVLAYNRHAAAEIRERLRLLIGDDARFVTVLTIHALAMRLVGASFAGRTTADEPDFKTLLSDATRLLRGDGLDKIEAEALRETLIEGFRWILVDEYQDVGPEEYALIAAVAGRSIDDPDQRISLFAVGDDDQNIYAFAGASVRHIRQFEQDYSAKPVFLTDNYRSSKHIISAANAVIEGSRERMKRGHGIAVDQSRQAELPGGVMEQFDPVAKGRVQILGCPAGDEAQALAAVNEMIRLSRLIPDWSWKGAAIISRDWRKLQPVRDFAEAMGIPVEMANESLPSIWRTREMQQFVSALRDKGSAMIDLRELTETLNTIPASRWTDRIGEGLGQLAREIQGKALPNPDVIEWFAEWSRETWGEQRGLKLLTAHRAKGLEFDDVVIMDGGWERPSRNEDQDAPRRLFYVAMTRARRNLIVMSNDHHEYLPTASPSVVTRHVVPDMTTVPGPRRFFQSPELRMVDLSFAGRQADRHEVQDAIAEARTGAPIRLAKVQDRWQIKDMKGRELGRMARAFAPPRNTKFVSGEIAAIIYRRKEDNEERFQHLLKRESWEVIVPQLVFEVAGEE